MPPRSPARKVLTVLIALGFAGVALSLAAGAVIMTGTKANTTFVKVSPGPGTPRTTTSTTGTAAATAGPAAAPAARP